MSKTIPTGAVGLKKGARASAVRPVQDYLKEFGYLESEGSPFVPDSMYMRRTSNDHILDTAPTATAGELDDATAPQVAVLAEDDGGVGHGRDWRHGPVLADVLARDAASVRVLLVVSLASSLRPCRHGPKGATRGAVR